MLPCHSGILFANLPNPLVCIASWRPSLDYRSAESSRFQNALNVLKRLCTGLTTQRDLLLHDPGKPPSRLLALNNFQIASDPSGIIIATFVPLGARESFASLCSLPRKDGLVNVSPLEVARG